ncbi:MAG: hypothetical protein ACI90V_009717 [Bacillariaceae sp.]|jgi:hypothetical protein
MCLCAFGSFEHIHGHENSFEAYKAMRSPAFYQYNIMYNTICLTAKSMVVLVFYWPPNYL